MAVVPIYKMKSGKLSVIVSRYSAEFRQQMGYVNAVWRDNLTINGQPAKGYLFEAEHRERVERIFRECFPEFGAALPTGPFAALPKVLIETVGVVANDGQTYAVVGGDADAMQGIVRGLEGRRWNGDLKLWEALHLAPDAIRAELAQGMQLVSASSLEQEEERELLAAQQAILAAEEKIKERIKNLDAQIAGYSRNSTSSVKAGLVRDAARLRHALNHARTPIGNLVELQARTLLAVVRDDL